MKRIQGGESIESIAMPPLTEEDAGEFFFMIGATGISVFLVALLKAAKTDDDLRTVASMGEMRHKLLETNASISYV